MTSRRRAGSGNDDQHLEGRRHATLLTMSERGESTRGSEGSALLTRVGAEVRRLRLERGLTQRELADRSGVVQQNLSLYERGQAEPRLSTLERLLDALDAEIVVVPRRQPRERAGSVEFKLDELLDLIDRQVQQALERGKRSA
jgi:transcriptional regulator with XRE-family HTH domain